MQKQLTKPKSPNYSYLFTTIFSILCVAALLATPFLTLSLSSRPVHAAGTIQGEVFRDYNYNGLRDGTDVGVPNITVTAYDSANVAQGTVATNGDGSYALSAAGTGPYRVEFSGIPAYLQPGVNGSGTGTVAGTTVQFVADGDTDNVNLALHNPADYCQDNPDMALGCYENGANIGSNGKGFISFPYDARGGNEAGTQTPGYTPPTGDATIGEVGTVWGTAYQRGTQRMYTASFIKRHSGLVDSPSTVYVLDYGSSGVPVTNFSLQDIVPANLATDGASISGSTVDLGSLCRRSATDGDPDDTCGLTGIALDYELPTDNQEPNVDLDAFDSVGKVSFGDIEMDETDNTLWLVNLNQQSLISMDVSNPNALPGAANQYLINALTGVPSCANGEYRPWGLAFNDGVGYLGGVCTAENGGDVDDLLAFVHSFDPSNVTAGLTAVASFPLNYNRETGWEAISDDQHWKPWTATWPTIGGTREDRGVYPQAIVSDIEFAADGSMILGIMDRWSHQTGGANYTAVSQSTDLFGTASAGDIVHLCYNDGAFVLEGETSGGFTCSTNEPQMDTLPSGHDTSGNPEFEQDDGPSGNGEYYPNDNRKGIHTEVSLGALASLKSDGTVASVVYDPWRDYDANGIHWYNTNDGIAVNAYEIVPAAMLPNNQELVPSQFGKAAGLGDLQLICELAPIEIGNRVWIDTNGNGIQDAGEAPVEGVEIALYDATGTTEIATAITDDQGEYYFNSSNVAGGLAINTTYQVSIDLDQTGQPTNALANYIPTRVDATSTIGDGNDDSRDSDGDPTVAENFSIAIVTTGGAGENDHTVDFGFTQAASIGDTVWFDTNADGIQDGDITGPGGEDGVNGVTVELYNDSDQLIDSTTTNADGFYQFVNLTPGDYYVQFVLATLPAGTVISPQDVGGNAAADDLVDSDADPTTGRTVITTLEPGENDPSWDLGIYEPAAIGNFVWFDANSNGLQDAGEPGVNSVTIELFDANGVSQGTTQTANDGFYEFIELTPGAYYVQFTLPDGTTWTQHSAGTDDTVDSDAVPNVDPATAQTEETTLIAGENDTTWDAGLIVVAEIALEKQVQDPANANAWVDADAAAVLHNVGEQAKYRFVITNVGESALTNVVLDDPTPGLSGCPIAELVDLTSVGGVLDPAESIIVEPTNCLSPVLTESGFTNIATVSGIPSLTNGTPIEDALELERGTIPPVTAEDPAIVSTLALATIGDKVWFDANANGLQDGNEPGIQSVVVALLDSTGTVDDTATTDANGNYLFPGLTPGSYALRFTLPNGTSWTVQDEGSGATADETDSDVNPATGETIATVLEPDETDLTWDAGIVVQAAIELEKQVQDPADSSVWHDADTTPITYPAGAQARYRFVITNNGTTALIGITLNDPTAGVSGCPTDLAVDLTDTTLSDGNGVLAPNEMIVIAPADCLSPVLDVNDFENNATVTGIPSQDDGTPLESALGLPAGTIPSVTDSDPAVVNSTALASIGDKVWLDANSNGIQDANEPGIADVMVQLLQPGNETPLQTTTTDVSGMYSFTELEPGGYFIRVVPPTGYTITGIDAGTDDQLDSDVDATTGQSIVTVLDEGEDDLSWDAGLVATTNLASLGNYVWLDMNADGIQDDTEEGLENVVVVLYDQDGNLIDTQTTAADGTYLFSDLEPGSYYVQFNLPNTVHYFFSPTGTTTVGLDSDAEPTTGRTVVTELVAGENDLTWDAGIYTPPLLSVSKVVNADTIQPGDPINYTLTYENSGLSTAIDAVITEVVPDHTTWSAVNSSAGWNCQGNQTEAGTICTYEIGDIPPLSTGNLTLSFVVFANQLLPEDVTFIQNEAFINDSGQNGTVLSGQSSGVITVPIKRPTALNEENEPESQELFRPRVYVPLLH